MTFPKTAYSRRPAMGTFFEAFLAGDDDEHLEAVAAAVLDEVTRLERLLSRFDPAAEVARINREACALPVRVDVDVWDILRRCEEYRRATGGYFDVTAASGASGASSASGASAASSAASARHERLGVLPDDRSTAVKRRDSEAAFERRRQQAEEHRRQVEQRNLQHAVQAGKAASALPTPKPGDMPR